MNSFPRFTVFLVTVTLPLIASSCVTYSNGARSYEEHVYKALEDQKQQLLDCGKTIKPTRLSRGEEFKVDLNFDFLINSDGQVTDPPSYHSTPIQSPALESCITKKLAFLRFDPPQGRIEGARMTYQIRFSYYRE